MRGLVGGIVVCVLGVSALWAYLDSRPTLVVQAAMPTEQPVLVVANQPPAQLELESELRRAPAALPLALPAVVLAETEPADEAPPTQAQLEAWIRDLHDDSVRWNATNAAYRLSQHMEQAEPLLLAALQSNDPQQRGLSAYLLSDHELKDAAAKEALVRVLAECYEHPENFEILESGSEGERVYTLTVDLHTNAYATFLLHPQYRQMALPAIERVWQRADDYMGLRAGYVLAHERHYRGREAVAQRAIDHLVDNEIFGDAALSLQTLTRMGDGALGAVVANLPGRDEQQGLLLAHWLSHFAVHDPRARRLSWKRLDQMGFWCGDWVVRELEAMR